jgi:hypothetical protein
MGELDAAVGRLTLQGVQRGAPTQDFGMKY